MAAGGVFTSHTAVAKPHQPAPHAWATQYVAVAIIMLSRHRADHYSITACQETVDELGRLITAATPQQNTTGWYLSVGPCHVIYTPEMALTTFRTTLPNDTPGYGTQFIIGGAASNRSTAARRWHDALTFVDERLRLTQTTERTKPAPAAPAHDPWRPPSHQVTRRTRRTNQI